MNAKLSMEFLKPFTGFFRKYTALLPSIIIVAAALLLFPLILLVGSWAKAEMKKSLDTAGNVSSLLNNVPSKDDPRRVKSYMDRLAEEASQVETLAVRSSMRELISYSIFPPKGTSVQLYVEYGEKYRQAINALIESMNALDAPSEAEIRDQSGDADNRNADRVNFMRPGGMRPGMPASRRTAAAVNPMVDALCLTRAREISVYAKPSVFAWYDFWKEYEFAGQTQAQEDCWDSQVAIWIYEDVVGTVRKMNEGSEKISSSPVKRLLGVSFAAPVTMEGAAANVLNSDFSRRNATVAFRDRPNYIAAADIGEEGAGSSRNTTRSTRSLTSRFVTSSLTARSSDEDVDIVHFAFSVLVDNRSVNAFEKELCSEKPHTFRVDYKEDGQRMDAVHNQITILKSDISAVDKQASEHALYRYGDGAVMQLDLVCEYQFYRKGYDVIKPEPIKEALGQTTEALGQNTSQKQTTTAPRFGP